MEAPLLLVFSCCWFLQASQAQLCTARTGDPTHCICETPNGVIDVTSIGNADKTPKWTKLLDGNQYPYGFNPCYGYSTASCNNAVACQEAGDSTYNCGGISTGNFFYDGSVSYLQYTDGDDSRITQVNLICDKSAEEPKAVALGDSFERLLFYEFDVRTKCACPGECSGGGGGGAAAGEVGLVLIFLSIGAFGAYFVIGAIVMYVKFEKRGIDMIPQKDFWMSVPFLIKDGFMFTFRPIIDRVRGGTTEHKGYSEL